MCGARLQREGAFADLHALVEVAGAFNEKGGLGQCLVWVG